jgi:RpiB/LacA/LacB family sugar-phosphate isomerase
MKKIFIGADHRGFKLKEELFYYLESKGYQVEDLGAHEYNIDDDYPDITFKLSERVRSEDSLGIVICGSSYGVMVAANKVKGIIATNPDSIEKAIEDRKHHGGNILCLSADNIDESIAKELVINWIQTEFEAGRHERRINKIIAYENTHR